MSDQPYPGFEGSVGPFPGQYARPHVYARDVHSGAGNCVCGRDPRHRLHPEVAPGFPNPDFALEIGGHSIPVRFDPSLPSGSVRLDTR